MNRLHQLGIFLLAVVAHIESLTYWFVAIDTPKLIASSRARSVGGVIEVVTRPLMHGTGFTDIALFYRPLSSLSYTVDYWLWGLDPTGYHLTTLILHGIVAVLIAIVVAAMTDSSTIGQLSAVLFALHPLTAEVVPAASRRHDIIMAIFMLGSLLLFVQYTKARDERRLYRLGGSLLLYALALGAKEPALIIPGLVFMWTVIHQFETPSDTLRTAVRDVAPFVAVTIAYLAVRFAVLGGLGGYHQRSSVTAPNVTRIVVEYFISILYPSPVINTGVTADGLWTGVLFVLGALIALIALCGVRSISRNQRATSTTLFAGFLGGCVAIPVLLASSPFETSYLSLLVHLKPRANHSYLYPGPTHAVIGMTLLGSCLIGVVWALSTRPSLLGNTDRSRSLAFFLVWFLAPLAVSFQSGLYTIRTGYAPLIPAMAMLSVLLVSASEAIRSQTAFSFDQNTAVVGIVLLLIVPIVITSPLIHPYDEWKDAGEVNRLTFQGIDKELEGTADTTTVKVVGLPNGIASSHNSFPRVKSIVYISPKATESWLRLQGPDWDTTSGITVVQGGQTKLEQVPDRISFNSTRSSGTVTVRLQYRYENEHDHLAQPKGNKG